MSNLRGPPHRYFDSWWSAAESVDSDILAQYTKWQVQAKKHAFDRNAFGGRVKLDAKPRSTRPASKPSLGWILVHSPTKYGPKMIYASPQEELADIEDWEFRDGLLWQWKWPHPLRDDGRRYDVLLGWEKSVFGSATVVVTRDIEESDEFNFAFILSDYRPITNPIPFTNLPLGKRARHHHSLIRLDEGIVAEYNRQSR